MTPERHSTAGWLAILAWALYDLANTIFSLNIHTLYFPVWLKNLSGGREYYFHWTLAAAMLAALILAPPLGVYADNRARRKPLLTLTTLVCIGCTALLALPGNYYAILALFFAASAAYFLANTFYDSLLASICKPELRGLVSGIGVGLGYTGSLLSLLIVGKMVGVDEQLQKSFVPTAVLFFIFALPCLLIVREGAAKPSAGESEKFSLFGNWIKAYRIIMRTPGAPAFFLASFFLLNAALTVIFNIGLYLEVVGNFDKATRDQFVAVGTVIALIAAFPLGWLIDRLHPKRILISNILVWFAGLTLIIFARTKFMTWVAAPFIGIGLAGTWTATRPLLLTLIPASEAATFFGFNAFAGRFAAIAGLVIWAVTMQLLQDAGELRYRVGLSILALMVIVALLIALQIPRIASGSRD